MPYIKTDDRVRLQHAGSTIDNAGELNYTLTVTILQNEDPALLVTELRGICDEYMQHHGLRYQFINDVMGACVSAKLEFQRRTNSTKYDGVFDHLAYDFYHEVAAPYEDTKIVENGDVFPGSTRRIELVDDGLGHDLEGVRRRD